MPALTITSTFSHTILPRTASGLSNNELELLQNNLGLKVSSDADTKLDESWQHKTSAELKHITNEQLKSIYKYYGRPVSNKNKD